MQDIVLKVKLNRLYDQRLLPGTFFPKIKEGEIVSMETMLGHIGKRTTVKWAEVE